MKIVANFEQDLKNQIKKNILFLSNNIHTQNLKKEFDLNNNTYWKKPIQHILIDYYNFMDRLIPEIPMKVVLTKNLKDSIYYKTYQYKINEIEKLFTLGKPVNEYLSSKHKKQYKFKDRLYQLLGIHHLHLGDLSPDGKKISRSDNLLILQIDHKNCIVYFLDIVSHKDFTKETINYYKYVNILVKEDLLKNNEYLFVLSNTDNSHKENSLTEEEYRRLVSKNFTVPINIGNTTIVPRARAGDSKGGSVIINACYYAEDVMHIVKFYEKMYSNIIGVHSLFKENLGMYPASVTQCKVNIHFPNLDLKHGIKISLSITIL
ncbi:hypothetical protein HAV_00388 [Candidatus Hepatincola sp. Av]